MMTRKFSLCITFAALTLVVVALLGGRVSAQTGTNCTAITGCVGENEVCRPYSACSAGNVSNACNMQCQRGLHCVITGSGSTGYCKSTMVAQNCTVDSDCQQISADPYMYCAINICTSLLGTNLPGDTCDRNVQCRNNKLCSDGLCTGVGIGGTCSSSYDCSPSLYCDLTSSPKVCKSRDDSNACSSGIECATNSKVCNVGKCIDIFSVPDSEQCDNTAACGMGEVCSTSFCLGSVPLNLENVVCQTNSNACPNAWSCTCDYNLGLNMCRAGGNQCVSQFKAYRTCTGTNKCHLYSDPRLVTSCAYKHCRSEWNDYQACIDLSQDNRLPDFCTSPASSLEFFLNFF